MADNQNQFSESLSQAKFLPDKPLTAEKEQDDRFGHTGIAENLNRIISNCPVPFTVGLFGKWGTGKTTILNILKDRLVAKKVPVISFDVWKYEGDALRRIFLMELVEQLKKQKYLHERFMLSTRIDKSIFTKRAIERIRWTTFSVAAGILLVGLLVGLFFSRLGWVDFSIYLSVAFSGSFVSGLLLWLFQRMIVTEEFTEKSERFQDPHEFEQEFSKIIEQASTGKVLIAIDNLDRCTHGKAVELLSTIKTFLAKDADVAANNKCIFLIACDDEAIKKHLESVYTKMQGEEGEREPFSADEFLRKFFNVFLRIPDFIDTELQTYTEDLLKETGIPQFDSPDVAYVITNAFRENPRQLKQFINTLLAHFLLSHQRESGQEPLIIPKGVITNNVAFLAKFLIIRQLFPSEYQQIRERHLSIKEMESIEIEEFKDFLRATKLIVADDIRPFIYLKQSKEELAISGIRELELGLMDDKQELVKEKLKAIKPNPDQVDSLKRFIPSLIDRNKNRRIPLLNITSCSLETFQHHNLELGQEFYDKIADLLNDDKALKPELQRFEPSLIFKEVLTRCKNKEDRNGVLTEYINILAKQKMAKEESKVSIDYAYSLLKELVEHKEWLKNKKTNIKQILAEVYYSSFKILSLFKDRIEDQKDFISEETISKFVSTFSNDDIENEQSINDKVGLLLSFKEVITPEVAQNIVTSLKNLLKNENQKGYRAEKENLLDRIGDVFDILSEQIVNIPDKAVLNSFADTVNQGMNALPNWDQKKIFVFTCVKLVDMLEGPSKSNINTLIQNFFTNADVNGIKFVFDRLTKRAKAELVEKYKDVLQGRAMQQQPIFDLVYPLASQAIRAHWMLNLIIISPQRASTKLEQLQYEVDDKRGVVTALLTATDTAPIQDKEVVYEAINKMKCAGDAQLRNNLASKIKSLLNNLDGNQQRVGYSALQGATSHLSATAKRQIARETVEWFRSLEPANAGQPYSIKSVILNWDILEPPVQSEYIDFVFDKLIKRGANLDNIRLGFEILSGIKPKYEDYSVYFVDAFARVESETNDQIKTELTTGLLKLKPQRIINKNKDFWAKAQQLQADSSVEN